MSAAGVDVTRAEVCAVACAQAWRGDGEVMASPFGTVPQLGARLARLTFAPDLVLTDGEAALMANTPSVSAGSDTFVLEAWMPYRRVFDVVWSGRRHGSGPSTRRGPAVRNPRRESAPRSGHGPARRDRPPSAQTWRADSHYEQCTSS